MIRPSIRCLIAGLFSVLPFAGVSVSAQPAVAPAAPPIAISSCDVPQWRPAGAFPYWRPWDYPVLGGGVPVTDGITISYTNVSTLVADRVLFAVNYRGDKERIADVGTFSPGATINHTFGQFSGLAYLGSRPNGCRVAAIRFTDGTAWRLHPMPH